MVLAVTPAWPNWQWEEGVHFHGALRKAMLEEPATPGSGEFLLLPVDWGSQPP